MPFVFVLFPAYGVKEVGKFIAYNEKGIIFLLILQQFRSCLY